MSRSSWKQESGQSAHIHDYLKPAKSAVNPWTNHTTGACAAEQISFLDQDAAQGFVGTNDLRKVSMFQEGLSVAPRVQDEIPLERCCKQGQRQSLVL